MAGDERTRRYCRLNSNFPLVIYSKNEKENVTREDKKGIRYIISVLKTEQKKAGGGRK